jgi:hypothetical protein
VWWIAGPPSIAGGAAPAIERQVPVGEEVLASAESSDLGQLARRGGDRLRGGQIRWSPDGADGGG